MATLPTPGGDIGTWGTELNEYLIEIREDLTDATNLAFAAHALATTASNTPDAVLAAALAAQAAAESHEADSLVAATSAAESAALAQTIADGIEASTGLPPGGADDQVLVRDSGVAVYGASWQNPSGAVTSVNGDTGVVVLAAADVGALADTYVAPVTSVNGFTGGVTLDAGDVGAVTAAEVDDIVDTNAQVVANTAARHTHANSATLAAITSAFTTEQATKLSGIETAADVTDATNVDAAGAVMNSDTSTAGMGFVIDEDSFATDTATKVPTQQSIKAYIATAINNNRYVFQYNTTTDLWPGAPVTTLPVIWLSTNDPAAVQPPAMREFDVWIQHPDAVI